MAVRIKLVDGSELVCEDKDIDDVSKAVRRGKKEFCCRPSREVDPNAPANPFDQACVAVDKIIRWDPV